MNRQAIAALVTAILWATSCIKEDKSSSISDTIHQREMSDGKRVLVHGYIEVDALDYPNFVEERGPPSGDRVTKSIDLVPHDSQVQKRLTELDGACVVVDGRFHLYGPNEVRLGNLVSVYGQIDAKEIHKCALENGK